MINTEADNLLFDTLLTQSLIDKNKRYMSSIPSEVELSSELVFSDEFKKKMNRLILGYRKNIAMKKTFIYAKKIVATILIAAGLGFGVLMLSQPVRATIQSIITQWFDEYTRFDFQSDTSVIEPSEYEFRYIPEGFEVSTHSVSNGSASYKYIDLHENDIFIQYFPATDEYSVSVDNEHSDYFTITLNRIEAHLFKSNTEGHRNYLLWEQEGYAFSIISSLDVEEIIKIAENIKLIKK